MASLFWKISLACVLISLRSYSQQSINREEIINIGGIKQYVLIKGKDDSKPIILFLHGGPAASLLNKVDKISGKLQEEFIVVHWDQRQTGKTLSLNKSTKPLTLDLFYQDTHDLIDSLLKMFHRPKLYLVGYSWGSGLGFNIAANYPELLYAYIAVSPVIDQWRSDSISLAMLKETMGSKARKELSQVKIPFENADQLYYHRKWLAKYEGQKFVIVGLRKSMVEAWAATWFKVWTRSCDINLFESLPSIRCPVYFFAGKQDYNTNSTITSEYAQKVSAPKKALVVIPDAGHGLPETHSGEFQEVIIKRILPQTFNNNAADSAH